MQRTIKPLRLVSLLRVFIPQAEGCARKIATLESHIQKVGSSGLSVCIVGLLLLLLQLQEGAISHGRPLLLRLARPGRIKAVGHLHGAPQGVDGAIRGLHHGFPEQVSDSPKNAAVGRGGGAGGQFFDEAELTIHGFAKTRGSLGLKLGGEFVQRQKHQDAGQQSAEGHRHDDRRTERNSATSRPRFLLLTLTIFRPSRGVYTSHP
mmetsp:Transcript_64786/g.103058  ORF Transcript_64786/g.103058 Transcript_64786/m.103058 type:complete len:206 (+) Transcript_64786:46-663(+)